MKQNVESATLQTNADLKQQNNPSFSKTEEDLRKEGEAKGQHLINNIPIEGTNLRIVGTDETGYKVLLGNVVASPDYKTVQECIDKVNNKSWELIMGVFSAMFTIVHLHMTKVISEQENNNTNEKI